MKIDNFEKQIRNDYINNGYTIYGLSKKYNFSRPTVRHFLKRLKIIRNKEENKEVRLNKKMNNFLNNKILINQIKKDYENYLSFKEITSKHKINVFDMNKIFKVLKINKRSRGETWHFKRKRKTKQKFDILLNDNEFCKLLRNTYEKEKSVLRTCKLLNISKHKCDELLLALNLKSYNKNTSKKIKDINEFIKNNEKLCKQIKQMYVEYLIPYKNIAKELNISKGNIAKILKKLNLYRTSQETLHLKLKSDKIIIFGPVTLYEYNGNKYQGSYELRFVIWLTRNNMKFQTHGNIKSFKYIDNNKERRFFPDFYIYDWNSYIDIKGRFIEEGKKKLKLVSKCNPKENFKMITGNDLIKMNAFYVFGKNTFKELQKYAIKKIKIAA